MAKRLVPLFLFPKETGMSRENMLWGIDNGAFEVQENSKKQDCIVYDGAPTLRAYQDKRKDLSKPKQTRKHVPKVKGVIQEGELLSIAPWAKEAKLSSPHYLSDAIDAGAFKDCDIDIVNKARGNRKRYVIEWPGDEKAKEIVLLVMRNMMPESMNALMKDILNEAKSEPAPDPEPKEEIVEEPPIDVEKIVAERVRAYAKEHFPEEVKVPEPEPVVVPQETVVRIVIEQQAGVCENCDKLKKQHHDKMNKLHVEHLNHLKDGVELNKKLEKQLGTSSGGLLKAKVDLKDVKVKNVELNQIVREQRLVIKELKSKKKKAQKSTTR